MNTTTILPGHDLAAPPAASWKRMVADGMPTSGVRSALRTRAQQVALFLSRYVPARWPSRGPYGDVRKYNGVRYVRVSGAGSVAIPGSALANHEDGLALDLFGDTLAWVRAHGRKYGWIIDNVKGEPWHVEYEAAHDTQTIRAILARITPKGGPDVFIMRRKVNGKYTYRLVTGTKTIAQTRAAVVALKRSGIKVVPLAAADYLRIYKALK